VRLEAFLSHVLDHDQLCRAPLLRAFLAHHSGGGGSASAATATESSTAGTGAQAEEARVAGTGSGGAGATADNEADMWAVEPVRSLLGGVSGIHSIII
jgi:hypothetical protein